MYKWTVLLLCQVLTSVSASASTPLADQYISTYKDIAIKEMHRAGIPASIKLAQGLLESDWGRSDLANVANNHFGIKCGSRWQGGTFYKEDDDKDDRGRLIASCFRSFRDGRESYEAHSEFLRDPRKAYRYGRLFDINPTDYVSWAHGLYEAGYATDPRYPDKLINIIEKYDLHRFDVLSLDNDIADEHIPEAQPVAAYTPRDRQVTVPEAIADYKISAINRVPMIIVPVSTTIADLATAVGLSSSQLIEYNDGFAEPVDAVESGSYIFLQRKKRSYSGDQEWHKVVEGETMASVAQLYGIKVQNLYAKNRMPKGAVPVPGEKLYLQKTVSVSDRPAFTTERDRNPTASRMTAGQG